MVDTRRNGSLVRPAEWSLESFAEPGRERWLCPATAAGLPRNYCARGRTAGSGKLPSGKASSDERQLWPKAIVISASSISLHQRHINLRLRGSRWFCRSIRASADACKGENNAQSKAWLLSVYFY